MPRAGGECPAPPAGMAQAHTGPEEQSIPGLEQDRGDGDDRRRQRVVFRLGSRVQGDLGPSRRARVCHELACAYLKMLTERAATSSTTIAETDDPVSINSFARRVSGIASVGLKAIEFVKDRYR